MTTLYEKINTTCEHGHYAIVHRPKTDEYRIVSPTKDGDGQWRYTGPRDSLENAVGCLGSNYGYTQEEWNELEAEGWVYDGVYHPPSPKPYKEGQKVRISEKVKDHDKFNNWHRKQKDMVGEICEIDIKGVSNSLEGFYYAVCTKDKSDWWGFPHKWLEPVFEDEEVGTKEKPKTIIIDGKEYNLIPKE